MQTAGARRCVLRCVYPVERYDDGDGMIVAHIPIPPGVAEAAEEERAGRTAVMREGNR